MDNHVVTILPTIHLPTPSPTNMWLQITVEYWVHTNRTTGEVKIEPGQMNAVIYPDTGNPKSTGT